MKLIKVRSRFLLGDKLIKIASLVLAIIFLFAAIGKLSNGSDFKKFLELSFHIKGSYNIALYFIIINIEFITFLSIIIYSEKGWPYLISSIMFLIFTLVISWGLVNGVEDSCGCFGGLIRDSGITLKSLLSNAIFLIISVVIYIDVER